MPPVKHADTIGGGISDDGSPVGKTAYLADTAHVAHDREGHVGAIDAVGMGRWLINGAGSFTNVGTGNQQNIQFGQSYFMDSGTTTGGSAQARRGHTDYSARLRGVWRVRRMQIQMHLWQQTAQRVYCFITNTASSVEPALTTRHLGFRVNDGVYRFSTGDGTTEEATDISSFVTLSGNIANSLFVITYDGTTARCYVDGALAATHSTNVPGTVASAFEWQWYIVNTAAASKAVAWNLQELEGENT